MQAWNNNNNKIHLALLRVRVTSAFHLARDTEPHSTVPWHWCNDDSEGRLRLTAAPASVFTGSLQSCCTPGLIHFAYNSCRECSLRKRSCRLLSIAKETSSTWWRRSSNCSEHVSVCLLWSHPESDFAMNFVTLNTKISLNSF